MRNCPISDNACQELSYPITDSGMKPYPRGWLRWGVGVWGIPAPPESDTLCRTHAFPGVARRERDAY